jgi:hypothetical protein
MENVKDLTDEQDYLLSFKYNTYLCPKYWENLDELSHLNWKSIKFNEENLSKVPEKPGLYSFIISPRKTNHPQNYLGYIGKTSRTLNQRFKEYLDELDSIKGRPKVIRFLNKWEGYIDFCYVVLEDEDLILLESKLNDAFLPPFNSDFSASINKIINAF